MKRFDLSLQSEIELCLTVPTLHLRGGVMYCAARLNEEAPFFCGDIHILHVGNIFDDSQHKHAWIIYLEFLVDGVTNIQSIVVSVIVICMSRSMLYRCPSFLNF